MRRKKEQIGTYTHEPTAIKPPPSFNKPKKKEVLEASDIEKKNINYWKDSVKDNFEDIKKPLLKVEDKISEDSEDNSADLPPQFKEVFMAEKSYVSIGDQFELAHILPHGYLQEDIAVPNPIDVQLLKNEVCMSNYNQLFQDSHLELIHSTYYGTKGTETSSLVNFRQMLSDKVIANKALNGHLRSFLIIHLASECDRVFKVKKEKLQKKREGKQVRRVTNFIIPESLYQ
ncbi:hypothetical protein BDF21DRAFT_462356 [Thamnidium elegans]|nr:hypothetical protein BDF21DRAFT_462356 [Thamnidium elegans]